jgi:hypothetical protein
VQKKKIAYFSLQLFLLKYSLSSAISSQPTTIFVIHRRDKVPRPYQTTGTITAHTKARTGVQKTTISTAVASLLTIHYISSPVTCES